MTETDKTGNENQKPSNPVNLEDELPEYYTKKNVVFGCGNILLGDDGFGPKVIEYYLTHNPVPEDSFLIDVGTAIRSILFDLIIAEKKPKNIIIIDAVDKDKKPGEIFEIEIEEVPINKVDDFSLHQQPTINLLKELRDYCNINIAILVCQVGHIPEEVQDGLSETMEKAVVPMCDKINEKIESFK